MCVGVCVGGVVRYRENGDLWAGKAWLAREEDHTSLGLLSEQRRQAPSFWLTGCQKSLSTHKTCDQSEVKWSFALFLPWQSHITDIFASAAVQILVFWFNLILRLMHSLQVGASVNDRTRINHCETQSCYISAIRTFKFRPQMYTDSFLQSY